MTPPCRRKGYTVVFIPYRAAPDVDEGIKPCDSRNSGGVKYLLHFHTLLFPRPLSPWTGRALVEKATSSPMRHPQNPHQDQLKHLDLPIVVEQVSLSEGIGRRKREITRLYGHPVAKNKHYLFSADNLGVLTCPDGKAEVHC